MKLDSKIILGRILEKFIDKGCCQVKGYNRFDFISFGYNQVIVGREKGKDTIIPFKKLLIAIEMYQDNPNDYDCGPAKTRDYGLTHINSPVWSLLHLLEKADYEI